MNVVGTVYGGQLASRDKPVTCGTVPGTGYLTLSPRILQGAVPIRLVQAVCCQRGHFDGEGMGWSTLSDELTVQHQDLKSLKLKLMRECI